MAYILIPRTPFEKFENYSTLLIITTDINICLYNP